MPHQLPRLRLGLDFMPSPDPDRPGLLIRDTYRFTDTMLLIPPPLVACLACFDGEQTELELRQELVRATGEIQVGELEKHLVEALSTAGFFEDEVFDRIRQEKIREFVESPRREATHAGSAYPDDPEEARSQLTHFMKDAAPETSDRP